MTGRHLALVTGGRTYPYRDIVHMTLNAVYVRHGPLLLFHGACKKKGTDELTGADRWADEWGQSIPDVEVVPFPADWHRYDNAAGPIRNRSMVTAAVQRVPLERIHALAFPEPGSRGTGNCVMIMKEFGIKPEIWDYAQVRRWRAGL